MEYVSRDTYQDRLPNFTTDINGAPTIADKIYETMSRNQAKLDRTRKF